jgi:hypothetical protein
VPDIYPPDYNTPVGQVRALIPDTEQVESNVDRDAPAEYLFTDDHLQALIAIWNGSILRAAAAAVDALATSQAYIVSVIKTEDLQTDGSKVANALRAHAKSLRDQADREDQEDAYEAFEIIDYVPYPAIEEWR